MVEIKKYAEVSSFWLDYKDALRNYILKIVKDKEVAGEITQQVLMKVYSSCCSGKTIQNLRSWLFQIAYNACMDHFKSTKQTKELPDLPTPDPEHEDPYQEANSLLHPLLKLLPEKYAVPLELSDLQGLKQQQVADRLGLSLTATKSRVQRGRQMIREKIMTCYNVELDQKGRLMSLERKDQCSGI